MSAYVFVCVCVCARLQLCKKTYIYPRAGLCGFRPDWGGSNLAGEGDSSYFTRRVLVYSCMRVSVCARVCVSACACVCACVCD